MNCLGRIRCNITIVRPIEFLFSTFQKATEAADSFKTYTCKRISLCKKLSGIYVNEAIFNVIKANYDLSTIQARLTPTSIWCRCKPTTTTSNSIPTTTSNNPTTTSNINPTTTSNSDPTTCNSDPTTATCNSDRTTATCNNDTTTTTTCNSDPTYNNEDKRAVKRILQQLKDEAEIDKVFNMPMYYFMSILFS
ncbi:hypothetical protein G6F22_014729 [Rhizopus arrhizus]|nr:hypothetical protein G6F22_014729 [Rhizopus arrhizus]